MTDYVVRPPADPAAPLRYDFERPKAISVRHGRTVGRVHTALAAGLATRLSDRLGEPVAVQCAATADVLAVDFEQSRTAPTALFRARVPLAVGRLPIALDLAPALATFLVERHLGSGDPLGTGARALSTLERRVVERHWLPLLADAFSAVWGCPPPQADGFDAFASRLPIALPDAPVVVLDLEVTVAERTALLAIAYPAETLRALLEATPATAVTAEEEGPLSPALDALPIDVRVELGRVRLPVGDLLRLTPGDVIALPHAADAPVTVWVGDRLRFEAQPGRNGRHVALLILTPPTPLDAPDRHDD